MPGSSTDLFRVKPLEKLSTVVDLFVRPLLGILHRTIDRRHQIVFLNRLHIFLKWESVTPKALAVEPSHRIGISDEPSFDRLDHQMALIFMQSSYLPVILLSKMILARQMDRALRIDQEHIEGIRMSFEPQLEILERSSTRATWDDVPLNAAQPSKLAQGIEEFTEPSADLAPGQPVVTSSFDVDPDLPHHRLPPISPLAQRSPNR